MRNRLREIDGNAPAYSTTWLGKLFHWVSYCQALESAAGDGASVKTISENLNCDRPTWKEADMNRPASNDSSQQLRVHIRWMIRRDMPEVLNIERESFEFPWFEEDFIRCLRQRNCIGMVAEQGERVVGFMIYELHKSRLHILNFAVAKGVRMRGIGRQMADKLASKLSSQRRTRITLEVRETNLAAQLFFKKVGFKAINVLRSYYEDSPEDAYVMQFACPADEFADSLPHNRIDRLAG
jgi:[ribosomal protein S18]-alanine N-acetyltransferase